MGGVAASSVPCAPGAACAAGAAAARFGPACLLGRAPNRSRPVCTLHTVSREIKTETYRKITTEMAKSNAIRLHPPSCPNRRTKNANLKSK